MPLGPAELAAIAATISAMVDVIRFGTDNFQQIYNRRLESRDNATRALQLQSALSTYSDRELEKITCRIESCRDRFIREGSGKQRVVCLCSVLTDVKDGNGGQIPVDEWDEMYEQLNCAG